MAGSSGKKRSAASRAIAGVAIVAVLLALALSAGWMYLAGELDRRVESAIEVAAGEGVSLSCANRSVFGYPFRISLSCDAVTVDAPQNGLRATGGHIRTAAQVYDPGRIVAEFGAPVSVDAPDLPPLDLVWDLGRASARFRTDGLEALSVAIDRPTVALRQPAAARQDLARSERLELHARRNNGDLDLALTDRALVVTPPQMEPLPPFDLSADMSVTGAADWMRRGLPGGRLERALRGQEGVVRVLRVELAGGGLTEISGPFSVSQTGEISGDFRLTVENPQGIADLVSRLVPEMAGIANSVAGGLGLAGRGENGRTSVDIRVRDGQAQLGFIPLGRIPPI